MTEQENKNNTFTTTKSPVQNEAEAYDKIQQMESSMEEERKLFKKDYGKLADENINLKGEIKDIREELDKVVNTNKALDKELWRQRQQKTAIGIEQQTEAQKIGKMALDIIKKRVRERYGTNCSCDDCKPISISRV